MSIFDDNFAYALVSSSDRTLQITGVNPAKYNAGNVNWGSIPAIPALYAGGTLAHNGYGAAENAFAVVEIANGAFNGRTEFAEGPLVLPNSLVRIGDNAFNRVKLSGRLTIPASVTYVGANAFANTLIDELLVENATMTDLLSGVVDATRVTSKEMEARAATDATLTALKVTKANPGFTGTTTIATAAISAMTVSGTATVKAANIAAASVNNTATVDYYENNVSEKNRNARVRVLSTAGNLLSVGGVNENVGAIEVVLSDGTYRTGAALVAALVTALNAKNIAWVGGQTISWNNTSFDANSNTVRLGYATNAPGSVMNPSIVIRTKFASNGLSYDSSSVLGAVGATVGTTYEPGTFILAYGNRSGLNFPLAINLGTPTLTVNGDATLVGSGTVTGNWNFGGNKPKYDAQVLATESFTQSKIQLINGASLLSTVKTLADIASAIGADPQFAVHVQASQSTILQSVVSLASVRSTEVSALSSALTAQVSALQFADASLSSAISGAVPVRVSQVESVSAVLQTAVSQMQSADASISTALSTATSQQSSQTLSLNLAISTAASLLQNADTALSTSLSTATLTRSLNVSTNSSTWSAHVSALQTADALLSTAMVDATSARSSAITSLSSLVSTTVPVLASGNATVQTALSTATTDRVASVVSLSGAVSTQVETTQSLNAVLLPQITAAASVAPAATTNTVFNLVGIAVNDVLTFRMSGGSGGFATGNRITITYSPTDFLKGTVTAVSGSDITFQVNQKATSATETSISASYGYPSASYTYNTNNFVFQLPITYPVFTATSNVVITSVTASMFTDNGVGTYSVLLRDTNDSAIAQSPSRQVNALALWNVMHTHTFTTAFVLNGATNLKIYAVGPWGRMVVNSYDYGAYTAIRGYAVNYSSGSVFIESNGALQSRRISAVGALSTSALGQVGSLASVRLANQSGIALQTSERIASVSSILSATAQSVLSLQAATSTHGSAVSVAVSARNSGVSLLTSSINASVSSLSLSVASISGALSAQIVNRSSQVLAAVTSLVGAAPASLDTLFEIAATLDAGPTMYSTLDSTETLAASNTTARITALSSVSASLSTAVSTLQLADASLSAGISTAVSDRISQAASLSSGASTFILSNQSTQSATSAGISDTASLRANGVASISTALAALSSAAQLSDLSASGSITAAISARQIGTTSTSAVLSTAVAGFQSVGAALSSAVSTAAFVRQSVTASVSAVLSGAVSGHHQSLAALSTAQSALSAGINVSALANLSDVNSAIGAVVGVGAVSALDTLNELATAISNNATIGTTLTGLINGKADQSVVAALSSAVLLKASQTDLTQLVSTVGTKAGDASVTQLQSAVSSMTVVTTSMSSQVQTLQTNTAASSQTIGLLSDTIRQVDTLYEYSGFVDANGAITYAVNNLSNMALQSSSLVFTIDAATYVVSKVAQLAVVRFDPTQTSMKYRSRGIEYPVDPVTLSGTYTYTFHVESSSATDYTNNATDLVITANPTALRTAPANSPFTVPKLALSGYTYAAPTVVTPYAAPTWSDATGKTSRVITVNFVSGVQHLEVGGTVYAVAGTTQLVRTLEYLPGATGTLVIKALNSATKLESASLSLSDVYTDYPQHAAPTEVGGSKTVTTSGSTYTYTATYATAASMVEVYDYDAQTSAYAAVATSVPVVGGQVSVSRSYLVGQIGQPLFQLRAKTGDGKRYSTFIVATAEAITFSKPVQSSVSYTTLSAESYRVTATYTVHPLATAVRVMNPSTSGTYIASQAASGGSVTFSVDYTEGQSVTIAVITLANSGGLQSVASDAFVPLGQYDLPVQVAGSKAITLSSGTYTQTAQYTSASPDGINVYAADGVTLVGSSTGASSPFTVTVTYAADKFGQTVALLSSKGTVNKRESARTTTITGEDIPTHVAPVISGAITYGTSGANYTAQMNYSVSSNVGAVRVLKADQTELPSGSTSVQQSIVSTTGATRVISVTVTFSDAVAPVNIVVVAEANTYGKQSAASDAQMLLGLHAAPVKASDPVYTTVSAGSYTASMTYTVATGVNAVQVQKASDNTVVSGATSSINSLIATITVPFTDAVAPFNFVVVALDSSVGRKSVPSATQTLVSAFAAPTVSGKIATSSVTTYSISNPASRTHATTFPYLGSMSSWTMTVYFKCVNANTWRSLIGSDRFNISGNERNWGIWVPPTNVVQWCWKDFDLITPLAVTANVDYQLRITKTSATIRFDLMNVGTGATVSHTENHANLSMGANGPVTIGGWINTAEFSDTIIAGVHVGSYALAASYSTPSTTGIKTYSSRDAFIGTVSTPGSGTFNTTTPEYDGGQIGQAVMKVTAAADATKHESARLVVNGEDTPTYAVPVLSGAVSYTGTNAAAFANATYTVAPNATTVSVYSNPTGPIVTGIATQYATVGTGVSTSGNWYAYFVLQISGGIHFVHYRLRFSNGMVSNLSIYSDSPQGLTSPDLSFALSNIPASGVTAILQGRNNAYAGNVWYDINVASQAITPANTTIKFGGGTTHQFAASPAIVAGDTVVASATVTTPGTIALSIPYTESDVTGGKTFYVVADANARGKQSAASVAQTLVGAFAAPTLNSVTYSGNTASMTYTVAAGVTEVQVRKASDNSVVSGVTSSINSLTATITVPFTDAVNVVVVALANSSGRESATSATQTLLGAFAAPVKASEPTYTTVSAGSYTANMTYTVAAGVTRVSALKASDTTYSVNPSPAMGQTLANFPTLGALKTWTVTMTQPTGSMWLVKASEPTKFPFYIDFRSDKALLSQYITAWGPDQAIMSGLHNLPRPTTFTVSFDANNFILRYGSGQVAVYPNHQSITSIDDIRNVPELINATYTGPVINQFNRWEMSIAFRSTDKNNAWRALIGDTKNAVNVSGWGVRISATNNIHFSWNGPTWEPTLTVAQNTDYVLVITKTSTSLTLELTNVAANTTQTATNTAMASYIMSANGPVTLGGWINDTSENFVGTISYVNVVPALASSIASGTSATLTVPFIDAASPLDVVVVALASSVSRASAPSATQPLLKLFAAPTFNSVTYSGNMAIMTYTVAAGVTEVQVRKASDNSVVSGVDSSVNSLTATITMILTDAVNIVVVATANEFGRKSAASVAQALLGAFAAPTLLNSVTYSGNTASMTYTVAAGVTAVQVRKADNSVVSGVTSSINSLTATITVPFTDVFNFFVVALANSSGRESAASVTQSLLSAFAAPILSGIITYSGNTASMTYTVAAGVTAVQVRKADNSVVSGVTSSINSLTATITVPFTDVFNFFVVALANSVGRESAASATQTLIKQFAAPVKASEPVYTAVSAGSFTANMTYNVDSGVTAVQVRKASDNTVVSGVTSSINSLTATIMVPFTNAVAPFNFVVVALATLSPSVRESVASVEQTLAKQLDMPTYSTMSQTGTDPYTASITYSVDNLANSVSVLKSSNTSYRMYFGNPSFNQPLANFPMLGGTLAWTFTITAQLGTAALFIPTRGYLKIIFESNRVVITNQTTYTEYITSGFHDLPRPTTFTLSQDSWCYLIRYDNNTKTKVVPNLYEYEPVISESANVNSTYTGPVTITNFKSRMRIAFRSTGGNNTWRALIGDRRNIPSNSINANKGWSIHISNANKLYFSYFGVNDVWDSGLSVAQNTDYVLTVIHDRSTSTTFELTNVSTNTTVSATLSTNLLLSGQGPVTVGGWINDSSENFIGTISYVNAVPALGHANVSGSNATVPVTFASADTPLSVVAVAQSPTGMISLPSESFYLTPTVRFSPPVYVSDSSTITNNVYMTTLTYTVVSGVTSTQTNNASATTSLSGTTATVVFPTEAGSISVTANGADPYKTSAPTVFTHTLPKIRISGYNGVVGPTISFNKTFGSQGTGNTQFYRPMGIAHAHYTDGAAVNPFIQPLLFVSDTENHRVQVYTSTLSNVTPPAYYTTLGTGSTGTADNELNKPQQVAYCYKNKRIAIADSVNNRIVIWNVVISMGSISFSFFTKFGSFGTGINNSQFNLPSGVAFDADGNIVVADTSNSRIKIFNSDGVHIRTWGTYGTANGQLNYPKHVAVNSIGHVIVGCYNGAQTFNQYGTFVIKFAGNLATGGNPPGVAVDNSGIGNVIISNYDSVYIFSSGGTLITTIFGSVGSGNGDFNHPSGVTVDHFGKIYVCERLNNRIKVLNTQSYLLDADGPTIKYVGSTADVPTSTPRFIQANPRGTGTEWFAVVKQGMKTAISNYASGTTALFIPPGQTVPVIWNNIVTTLMTDMSDLFTFMSFNPTPTISSWDTSIVTNMQRMFQNNYTFNGNIGSWNTSNVTNMSSMFQGADMFNQPIGSWNTSNVTDMSYMFYSADAFNQPIGSWNTANVTNMYSMFRAAVAFNQPIGSWNTANVIDMRDMFRDASAFNQNISGWVISSTLISYNYFTDFRLNSPLTSDNTPLFPLFYNASEISPAIVYIGSAADVPTSTPRFVQANPRGTGMEWFAVVKQDMKAAISNYASGTTAPFIPPGQSVPVIWNNIVTTLMTDMSNLFLNKTTFNQPIRAWHTSNVITMANMFQNASAFNQNVSGWTVAQVTNYADFRTGSALTSANTPPLFVTAVPLVLNANGQTIQYVGSDADVPTSTPLFIQANPRGTGTEWFAVVKQGMKTAISSYSSASVPFTPSGQSVPVALNNIVTTLMTDMSSLFYNKGGLFAVKPSVSIRSWDTSRVTNMSSMFLDNNSVNVTMSSWNTSNVTNMSQMFRNAVKFSQSIGAWNTSNVTNMQGMFWGASIFNQPIGTWNTAAVGSMGYMFNSAAAFNQPIGTWNTAAVTNMEYMFNSAAAFNQPIGTWNTANVQYMNYMFNLAAAFNQPIGTWNTADVYNMDFMFVFANAFNQDVSGWFINGTNNNTTSRFGGGGFSTINYIPVAFRYRY